MRAERGFTLLEILVAISIASLLLLAIYGVFGSLSSARDQLEERGAIYHQARVFCDRLGRELRSLRPVTPGKALPLSGGHDEHNRAYLELVSLAGTPQGGIPGGVATIRYLRSEDPTPGSKEQALFRREQASWTSRDDELGQKLIRSVADFTVSFYDGSQWQEEWTAMSNLPQAVRIELVLLDGDERVPFRTELDLP